MLKVRIGASLDSSVAAVFKQLPTLARQARAQVETELNKMGQSPYRDAPAHAKKDLDKVTQEVEKSVKNQTAAQEKGAKYAADMRTRYFLQEQRAGEKAAQATARAWESSLKNIARNSASTFAGIAKAGGHVAGSVARGYGVNLDLGGMISSNVGAREGAALLSRKGFQEGQEGVAGQKQDPAAIYKDMRAAADATAMSTEKVNDAMKQFVNNSGDLDTSRKIIADIGMIANSTGADFSLLANAAGAIDLKLDKTFGADQVGKIEAIKDAIRGLSAQGKLGAIDMEDLVRQVPKLLAVAGRFKGDRGQLIGEVGFLAQEAKKAGGAGTAAQAATAVAALPQDLKKKANRKALAAAGIDLFTDKSEQYMRDPVQLIREAVIKTKGSQAKLGDIFKGASVGRAVEGLRSTYTEAGGGAAGIKAMDDEIKQLGGAILSEATIRKDNADRLAEGTAKAQVFQNRLEDIAGSMADRVLPALEKAAPAILEIAVAGSKLAGFLSEHLGATLLAAVGASIAKAALGQAIGSMLKGILSGQGASGGGLGGAGPVGAAMGVGAAIGAGAVTQAQVATDNTVDRAGAKQDEIQQILADAKKAYKEKRISKEQLGSIQQLGVGATDTNQRVRDAENASSNPLRYLINRGSGILGSKGAGQANMDHNTGADKALEAINNQQLAVLRAISSGVLRVEVTNPKSIGAGAAPPTTNIGALGHH